MPDLWNVDWPNANSQRKYPLSEIATCMDVTETYRLPDDFLVDAALALDMGDAKLIGRYLLMSISTYGDVVRAVVGYAPPDGSACVEVGTVTASRVTHVAYSGYTFDGGDPRGRFTIGNLDGVIDRGGHFEFDLDGGRLEPCVARPSLVGVRSIQLVGGTPNLQGRVLAEFTGDVRFVAGTNFRFEPTAGNRPGSMVKCSAGWQDGMVAASDAGPDGPVGAPVHSINGVVPDRAGNINLQGDDCSRFAPTGNFGLGLTNRCATSCCGCTELAKIMQDLNVLNSQVIGMESLIQSLQSTMLQSMATIVASKAQNVDVEARNAPPLELPDKILVPEPPPTVVTPPVTPGTGPEDSNVAIPHVAVTEFKWTILHYPANPALRATTVRCTIVVRNNAPAGGKAQAAATGSMTFSGASVPAKSFSSNPLGPGNSQTIAIEHTFSRAGVSPPPLTITAVVSWAGKTAYSNPLTI